MLGGTSGLRRQEIVVSAAITTIRTPPPAASTRAIAVSSGVSMLKCEGTCRHACTVIRATSVTQAAANGTSSHRRARTLSGR